PPEQCGSGRGTHDRSGCAFDRAVVRSRRGADQANRVEPGDQRTARDAGRRMSAAQGNVRNGRRRVDHRARRRDRDSARRAGRAVSALSRQLRQGRRPRPRNRPSDCDRLQRRDSGQLAPGRRHNGVGAASGARRGDSMTTVVGANALADTPVAERRARILVVDDERSMRELLAIVLRREGYEVLLAENGKSAIATLEKEPVDLLISDIKMPDLSGVDVLRAAKRVDQDILGIMITAFASTETAVEAMRLGACDYLSKPFDVDLLRM